MSRRTPLVFLLIFGLSIIGSTNAVELVSGDLGSSSTQPKSFMVDAESASLEKRQHYGIDLDSEGMLDARDAAAEAMPSEPGKVKSSRLIVFDSAAFEPGFFDGSIFLELPTNQSCIADPIKIRKEENGDTTWIGRCESGMGDGDVITLSIYPNKQLIIGFISWGGRQYEIRSTRKKPFQVINEFDTDYVSERRATY